MTQKPDPLKLARELDSRFMEISEVELKDLQQKLAEVEAVTLKDLQQTLSEAGALIQRTRQLCAASADVAFTLEQKLKSELHAAKA